MAEKSIQSDASIQLKGLLPQLTTEQLRYVVARQRFPTVQAAAESVGLRPNTVYRWPSVVKEAVRLMAYDGVTTARFILEQAIPEAAEVKVSALKLGRRYERIRQDAASEILDRNLGKPTQSIEQVGDAADAVADLSRRMAATLPDNG